MKTPTLEEVKEYFKNAKEIQTPIGGGTFKIDTEKYGVYYDNYSVIRQNYDDNSSSILLFYAGNYSKIISYKEPKTDSIVESVINQFKERSEVGIKKYGTTLDRNDLTTLEWIEHAKQEAMDFILYLEKLKREYEKLKREYDTTRN